MPKIYDPFLSRPYHGTIKKMFSPSIINDTSRENYIRHVCSGSDHRFNEVLYLVTLIAQEQWLYT